MYEQVEKPKENKSRAVANSVAQKKSNGQQGFGFVDNRHEAITQRKVREMANQNVKSGAIHSNLDGISPLQGETKTIQMEVKKFNGFWFTSYDPYTPFNTQKEAKDHEKLLRPSKQEFDSRVPTLYSYTHIKPTNKLSNIPQGPHTYAHKGMLVPLQNVTTKDEIKDLYDNQILDPNDLNDLMEEEAPKKGYNSTIKPRIERYKNDYQDIYDETESMFKQKNPNLIELKHNVNKMMNMDPYQVYGWKSTSSASKKSLWGKGEGKQNPTFDDLMDKPKASYFKNQDAFKSMKKSRNDMFDEYKNEF